MATVALGVAGAVVGSAFGNPALGWAIGTTLAGVLFPPRVPDQERGRLDDLRITSSAYGVGIPRVWGRARLGGVVVWSTDLREHVSEEKVGGKGGGGGSKVRTYTYTASFAVAVCRGSVESIRRIWAEDVLIFDATAETPTAHALTIYNGSARVYPSAGAQNPDPVVEAVEGVGSTPAYRGLCYVVFEELDLSSWGNRIPNLSFEVWNDDVPTVGSVVSDLLLEAGLDESEIDTVDGTSSVYGFTLVSRTAIRDSLDALSRVFSFDLAEVDDVLRLVPRGGDLVDAVDPAFYGASAGEPKGNPRLETRTVQAVELPFRVDLTYFAADKQYQTAAQGATRVAKDLDAVDALTVNTALTLTDTQARRAAERILYTTWSERETTTLRLPWRFLKLAPADPVELTVNGSTRRFRVVGAGVGLFAELRFVVTPDVPAILTQWVEGATLEPYADEVLSEVMASGFVWDGNALRDSQADSYGVYFAYTADADDFFSYLAQATVELSTDGGSTWSTVGTYTERTIVGETESVLGAPDPLTSGLWDETNVVDVSVVRGVPGSLSAEDVLANGNAVLVGDEVIQYRTATALGAGVYRLSGLLRGRRGTLANASSHGLGERVVFLGSGSGVHRLTLDAALLGSTILFRVVGYGVDPGSVPTQSVDFVGRNFWPFEPTDLVGEFDLGSGDFSLEWKRQARKDFVMVPGGDVPLGEASERYEVDIYDAAGVDLLRTVSGLTSPTMTYTAAMQTADGLTPGADAFVVEVYQLGRLGRGYTIPKLFDPSV